MPTTDEILKKYSKKIEQEFGSFKPAENYSREYTQFKQDMLPEMSRYKNWCNTLGNLVKMKVSGKDRKKIQRYLDIAHLDVDPSQTIALAVFSFVTVFFLTLLTTAAVFFITNSFPSLLLLLGLITGLFVFYYAYTLPKRLANIWRLKASSQMVPAVLYTVIYMKHTSNLERAIEFTSQHLDVPLSLDFKKVFYDVQVGRYSTIKQSLDNYLQTWRDYAPEFIESFHLIESSLYEPSEDRRVKILEKSLQIILDGVYEKMLAYSRDIRSPLTNLYMLGIILPTLALSLLPLASTLLQGAITWLHVIVFFNILIPFFVFYMASEILLKRPGGYGETSVLELNPNYYKYKSKKPWLIAALICLPLLIIALVPFIFQIDFLTSSLNLQSDYTFHELRSEFFEDQKLFDFKTLSDGSRVGPFGMAAVLFSLFLPLSIGLFFSIAYGLKTRELIKARNQTKKLEKEFTNSLFQLGNRLGDGVPAELAFSKVAQSTVGLKTHNFFSLVNHNIQQAGMSVEKAIFDPNRGAIRYFPSALIATSMRILIESVKKGLNVAARSLMSISEYMKNIHKISERLRDLLAEVVSDMRSNMVFLAPVLAGIVVGLASMITIILNTLQNLINTTNDAELAGLGNIINITSIFNVNAMIPPYFIQASIGIYIIEIIFILSGTLVTIDAGKDRLREKNELYKDLLRGLTLYLITALVSTLALVGLASFALSSIS